MDSGIESYLQTLLIGENLPMYPAPMGAITQLYVATSPELKMSDSGRYFIPWARAGINLFYQQTYHRANAECFDHSTLSVEAGQNAIRLICLSISPSSQSLYELSLGLCPLESGN